MNSLSQANNNSQTPLDFLRSVSIFEGLDQNVLEEIAGLMKFRSFGTGLTLFHQDMPGTTLYLIAEGYVRIYAIGQTGQEFTYYIYGPSEVFGELSLLDDGYHSATCITMTPIKTWMLSKEHLLGIINKYPLISLQFLRMVARRVRSATQKSEAMAFQDVQGRLAYEMLSLASRSSTHTVDGTLIEVPLNQIELASMVGATRESVNKALAMFKSQNLIKLTGTSIVITNRDGLEKITLERGR